jgi:hypothetical protein
MNYTLNHCPKILDKRKYLEPPDSLAMRYLLRFLFLGILFSLLAGLYVKGSSNSLLGNKIIGFTVLTSAFIFMPLFLVHRWKGKKLKDYTLSQKNLEKLRNSDQKK